MKRTITMSGPLKGKNARRVMIRQAVKVTKTRWTSNRSRKDNVGDEENGSAATAPRNARLVNRWYEFDLMIIPEVKKAVTVSSWREEL